VTVRVTASKDAAALALREAVTTAPADRVAMLRVPIEWLCVGQVRPGAATGEVITSCKKGETCAAGACVPAVVDATTLPDYAPEQVFGGGSGTGDGRCFDAAECLRGAEPAVVDLSTCTVAAAPGKNIALATETDGLCGPAGCFVVLDAGSARGFTAGAAPGTAALPAAVCARIDAGDLLGVITARTSSACAQKTEAIPSCGAWSSVGPAVPEPGAAAPVTLAAGQRRPVDLIASGRSVYWTSLGTHGLKDGEVRAIAAEGGRRATLGGGLGGPRGLALTGTRLLWTASGLSASDGSVSILDLAVGDQQPTTLASGLHAPEGIAAQAGEAFFTDFLDGAVYRLPLDAPEPALLASDQRAPYRIAVHGDRVYWTDEGTGGEADGAVLSVRLPAGVIVPLAEGQPTPRRLALDIEGGRAVAVYWTNFGYAGSVMTVPLSEDGASGPPQVVAKGQRYPNGVAVDSASIYWTNRGDGTVMRLPKGAQAGGAPEVIADHQASPGAIDASGESVIWINEGASDQANGAVMRMAKP
jgi:hypothetical protein